MSEEPQKKLIKTFGKKIHIEYLHRRTCPYELVCLKNLLEGNYETLFKEPELAKIVTEQYCTIFSEYPEICPFLETSVEHCED